MLTPKPKEVDKIVGLSVGTDDFNTKPFSPRELIARIKARLRRPRNASINSSQGVTEESLPPPRQFGELQLYEARHEVEKAGLGIGLTSHEFDLLATLTRHPGRVFTRNQLLEQVWGDEYYDDHVVDVHIANL